MPINTTSPNPGGKFSPNPGLHLLNNGTPYLTLIVSTCLAFAFVLALYARLGGNPLNRMGFGLFVSVLPALGTLAFLRITKLLVTWRGVATIYLVLFFLIVIIQQFSRMIPVYQ